jgi:hypothetical protein
MNSIARRCLFLTIGLFSCQEVESTSASFSKDSLLYIDIQDTIVKNFLTEFIKRNDDKRQCFYTVKSSSDYLNTYTYEIAKRINTDFNDTSEVPLTYTMLGGVPVFLHSGIDHLLPSRIRYHEYVALCKKYVDPALSGYIYCGYSGQIIICEGSVRSFSFEGGDSTHPCVSVETIKFLPPRKP